MTKEHNHSADAMAQDQQNDLQPAQSSPGKWSWLGLFILMAWAAIAMLASQGIVLFLAWMTDASYLGYSPQDVLIKGMAGPLVAGIPLLLGLLIRGRRPRAMLYTLMTAVVAAFLFMLPRALYPPVASYAPLLLRATLGLLVGAGLLFWARKQDRLGRHQATTLALSLFLGLLFLMPWLIYGALGDGFDLLVGVLQALGLGLTLVGLVANLLPQLVETGDNARRNLALGGVTLFTSFLIVGVSWGQMDYQMLLTLVLPMLAFPMALFGLQQRRYPWVPGLALAWLATFGPLAFFDPMELNLVSYLSGEAAKFAVNAAMIDVVIGLILLVVMLIWPDAWLRPRLKKAWTGLAGVAAVAAIAVYVFAGHPGFFGDDFFVVLNSQADLSQAQNISDVDARRAWVYQTLVDHADAEQADLMAWLDARGIPYTRYYLTNGIEVHASAIRRWQISRRPDVYKIVYSPTPRPIQERMPLEPGDAEQPTAPTWGLEAIGVPRVWEEFGVRGEGVVVGSSDSGVYGDHPALADGYRGAAMGSDDYNWLDPWYGRPKPYDQNGHGTHTIATAVGNGFVGVAPDATWFACSNLQRANGNVAYYLDCMQFMLAPYPQSGDALRDGRTDLAADVSTNSWGCPARLEGCDDETLLFASRAMRDAGIMFVVAIGNEGPECNSAQAPPGNYANTVLSVGAMTPEGDVADFSDRGSDDPNVVSPDGSRGPDLIAPGVDIVSAWPDGGWFKTEGTSMAAPHVTGVVALMWSANPALRGQVQETERILIETASLYQGADDVYGCSPPDEIPSAYYGYGVVNAYEAVKAALPWQP